MEKTLRIFISSVGMMMSEERDTLRDKIWKIGHIPIAMEAFSGNHSQRSIDIVIDNLNKAHVIIFVLGFTYGSIIGDGLTCDSKCPVYDICEKNANKNKRKKKVKCSVSYTHFEYLFAKKNGILHYCIIQKNLESGEKFEERLTALKKDIDERALSSFRRDYYSDNNKAQFTLAQNDALKNWSFFYDASSPNGVKASINEAFIAIQKKLHEDIENIPGLVEGRIVEEKIHVYESKIARLEEDVKNLTYRNISEMPATAVTGTCIPFQYDQERDKIYTFLICNKAYSGDKRFMFPGGHAFRNDDSPEAVAASKALSEAGLVVATVDMYKSFDMSNTPEKSLYRNFTVYRPPHYTYLFSQNKMAKCYTEFNHKYHYDAVYVFEIKEIREEKYCSQERISVELPNECVSFKEIKKCINVAIEKYNIERKTNEGIENKICSMLYEAHRDYVSHINSVEKEGEKWVR